MVEEKTIFADCSVCKKRIEIKVPVHLAEDREYYPFEFINIHGNPEHALMLFIDKNLTIRDTMVYEDLHILKERKKPMDVWDKICSVCKMEIDLELETVRKCVNGHSIHEDCYNEWIKHSSSCPKCKKPLIE